MIEWTDETWNPVRGCSRVSEGCRHCYAETMAGRIVRMSKGKPTKYDGLVTINARGEARWTGIVGFDAVTLAAPLSWRKPRTIFVNSMSDLFHDGFTDEQIAAVFGVMAACPQHTFQVLTKRPKRMREWFEWAAVGAFDRVLCYADDVLHSSNRAALAWAGRGGRSDAWPLPNVILGVSVENQATADDRIPHLLATPAAVCMVSAEPLLGPLRLDDIGKGWSALAKTFSSSITTRGGRVGIDWVIAGCESGPNARPCEVDWLRSLRDQCVAAEVPFFLKQARETPYLDDREDPREVGYPPPGGTPTPTPICVGPGSTRKPGGIIGLPYLDGVQWAQMPEVSR